MRRREQRGAVAVEAALVTPLVFLLIFGILEGGFLMRDYVSVTSATRVAARVASTGAGAGSCIPEPDDEVPCPGGAVPELAQLAADEISVTASALPKESIKYLMVYKANDAGFPNSLDAIPDVAACTTDCVVYKWSVAKNRFRYSQGTWNSRGISACANPVLGPLDSVGIYLAADFKAKTGVFGKSHTIGDRAVMKFEPLSNFTCKAGEHL